MKKNIYIIPVLLLVLFGTSCKKYLDINANPNAPLDVQESLILFPVETSISTVLAGGSLTQGNYPTVGLTDAYWTQQVALNQTAPQIDEYKLTPADLDQIFLVMYDNELQNLLILNRKAEANGNHSYGVVAKTLTAYVLGIATDMWGDVPYSKGFDGKLIVPYDKQEDVYKTIQSLLDSAILENGMSVGKSTPGTGDDPIYEGDMTKWVKFANTLKARYYMHLTKAPGYDAVKQSQLALTALQNGFASQDDEATFAIYSNAAGSEGPWFMNIQPGNGPVVLASTFVDNMATRNDPRLPIIATKGSGGTYNGRVIGTAPAGNSATYSNINSFYAAKSSPQYIMNYSEALFLQAEATFRTQGAAAANPIYIAAIESHMSKLGLDPTSTAVQTYITSRSPLTAANGIQLIMEEKFMANFLSIENYNDWRRTGFPVLNKVQNAYMLSDVARRYPYPLGERTANPQPQQNVALSDRVWWDAQ